VLAEPQSVLLIRIRSPEGKSFWITPGGGLDPHETHEVGLRRELKEELGLDEFDVGPLIWRRDHTFNWGERRLRQREHFHVVHVPRFEPLMTDPLEATWVERFHWWTLEELRATDEEIVPVSLVEIVVRYLTEGAPHDLPDWEVLVDEED
jgi:ADP-ribose pyrophosphatase YjhB (NUDIX family)